jgi:hypothetical protein
MRIFHQTSKMAFSLALLSLASSTALFAQPTLGTANASPASGAGPTTFTISASDSSGAGALTSVQMLINYSIVGPNSCYVLYIPGQGLYLSTDTGGWYGPSVPVTGQNLSNGQCTLNVAATTVTAVGNTVTMKPVITFDPSFVGALGVYGYASDAGGLAIGFQQLLTYTAFAANTQLPSGSVSPNVGTGMSKVFTVSSTDVNGWKYIAYQQLLIGPNNSTLANSCAVVMYGAGGGAIYLMNDAYTAWQGPIVPNTPGTLHNNQCTIDSGSSTKSASGNNLTFNLSVTFTAAFAGTQNLYLNSTDQHGQSTGFLLKATWTVPTITAVSVTPNPGSGSGGTLSEVYSDTAGGADITQVWTFLRAGFPSPTADHACYVRWDKSTNSVFLLTDGGSTWSPGYVISTNATPFNSQCTLNVGASSVSIAGNNLTLNLALTFTPAFAGAQQIWMYGNDTGQASGWQQRGTYTVAAAPLTITTASPLANETTGTPYSLPFIASGGIPSNYTWSRTFGSLPPGLTLSPTGMLSGTPTTPNIYNFTVQVADGVDPSFSKSFSLTVSAPAPDFSLSISPSSATVSTGLTYPYTVALTCLSGFTGTVSLTTQSAPSGVTAGYGATTLNCATGLSTKLTVSTTTDTSGNIVLNGSSGSLNHNASAALIVSSSDLLQSLRNCVASSGSGACNPLGPGTYRVLVSQPPIDIGRSGVAVSGDSSNPTMLVRDQTLTKPMMEVGSTNDVPNTLALTGITIQNLTFCSGGTKYHKLGLGDPNNPCPLTPSNALTTCETNGYACLDLSIKNTAAGQSWAAPAGGPFTNAGPYNVEIAHCNFEDSSGGHPILVSQETTGTGARQMVNDVYFHDNVITDGGVQIGASNGVNWDDYTQCDNWYDVNHTVFADDNGATLPVTPRDIRFEHNTFYSTAGAISGQGRYIGIYNNTFVATLGGGGGAIEQEMCSDQVSITGNTLTGGSPDPGLGNTDGLSGMELYSRNLTVSRNTVSGFATEGIGILSVNGALVTFNHVWGNNRSGSNDADIKVTTRFSGSTCHPGPNPVTCDAMRDATGNSIQDNDSGGNPASGSGQYGIYLIEGGEGSTNNVHLDAVSGNTFHVTIDKRVNVNTAAITGSFTTLIQTGPEIIAAFPEGNQPLGKPLGTSDPGATNPPTPNRRFFRFGVNDADGPTSFNGTFCEGNFCSYALLQGIFDTATGARGSLEGPYPTQAACHFIYFPDPAVNMVYLDSPLADMTWTGGSSVIGSGVDALNNGVCKIYAASSSVDTTSTAHNIVLVLDVEFRQTGAWYMYEAATNTHDAHTVTNQTDSSGHLLLTPWSLWGYWPVNSVPQ